MIYALQRLQTKMAADLEKYGIETRPEENLIIYRDVATKFRDYTDYTVLERKVKEMIRDAKRRKKEADQARQTNLLGDL